jgi:hypothetical protein
MKLTDNSHSEMRLLVILMINTIRGTTVTGWLKMGNTVKRHKFCGWLILHYGVNNMGCILMYISVWLT